MSVDCTCEKCGTEYDLDDGHPAAVCAKSMAESAQSDVADHEAALEEYGAVIEALVNFVEEANARSADCLTCELDMNDRHESDCKFVALMRAAGRR